VSDRLTDLTRIIGSLQSKAMTRRQMLKSSAVVGVGAALLAACDADDDDVVDDVETDDAPDPGDEPDDDEPDVDDDEPDDDVVDDEEDDDEPVDEPDDEEDDEEVDDVDDDDRYGGQIEVALIGEPPSMDHTQTSATVTTLVVTHFYEYLFTWDEEFEDIPELVDTWEIEDDGLLNVVHLREGVMFHNGDEMTADDVYASIDRWANQVEVGFGVELMGATEEMRVVDDYTIEFEMNEPFGTFAVVLGRQNNGCAIYPAEVAEAAGSSAIDDYIGTGPYQFVEWVSDQHILVERFDDYSARDEEPNGYGGGKTAYADSIRFIPVPDEAARVAGLQAGDYDYLEDISADNFETIEGSDGVVAEIGPPTGNDQIVFNMVEGIMTDINMRRAVQATVNHEQIMIAAYGEDNYRVGPAHSPEETIWFNEAGAELYDMQDLDQAEQYLEDAGYDGEEVRLLCTQEYSDNYNTAVVLQQQLGDIGMNVELEVFDWATMLETRDDLEAWDMVITGFTFRVDPTQLPFMRCEWGGHWCSDEKVELVNRLFSEVELDDRLEVWEELQELIYEEVPMIKTGEGLNLLAYSERLQGLENTMLAPAFWNTWLED
jgi:peptide/nickel transport system substrate-binding protein